MNTAWNRRCRNLPSGTALSLYDNRITPIIITDITRRCNVRIQNPYTCTTLSSSDDFDYECLLKKLCVLLCRPQNAPECTSEHLQLSNFLGEHAPRPPCNERLQGSHFSTLANDITPQMGKVMYSPDWLATTTNRQLIKTSKNLLSN